MADKYERRTCTQPVPTDLFGRDARLPNIALSRSHTDIPIKPHSPSKRHGFNNFLLLFDNSSGLNKMTYFLIDDSGLRTTIIPKPNTKTVNKVKDIVDYRMVVMDNFLYMVGGRHLQSGSVLSNCYRFNPINNQWVAIANMLRARVRHTVTALHGRLYVCGGENRNGRFIDCLECYDPLTDTWTELRGMPESRADHAACAYKGKLYVTGGLGQFSGGNINFWQYDPASDFWTHGQGPSSLSRPKERHSMLEHKGKLYVIGGVTAKKSGRKFVDTEDASLVTFDCSKANVEPTICGMWDRSHPDMTRPRCKGDCIAIGHYIYHIGGYNYTQGENVLGIEYYNTRRKRWYDSFTLPAGTFSSVQCCVISVPNSNKEFSTLGLAMSNKWIMW